MKDETFGASSEFKYYLSAAHYSPMTGGILVRTRGNAARYSEVIRRQLQREMPGAAYVTAVPFSDIISSRTRSWRLGAMMFVAFGGLALVLAAIGLYSVIAYDVAHRSHELGIRVALGAERGDVMRLVVASGVRLAAIGTTIGVGIALWASEWVKPLLFDVSPRDPAVFSLVGVTLIGVALATSWMPARRASRVDSNVALRAE